MELRSGWGPAALVGTLALGLLARPPRGERSPVEATARPESATPTPAPAPRTGGGTDDASEEKSTDSLERPVDEIRKFFGARTNRKPAAEESELAEAIRTCLHCQAPEKPVRPAPNLAREIQGLAASRGYELQFLIALVPDPLVSYIGSQFDTYTTALLRGATASGWLSDRHWLPWRDSDPEEASGRESRQPSASRYRRSPGIILFRKPSQRILLAVFLVGESPLTGIRKGPFVDTLRLVSSIQPGKEIRVLGPFSSGAARSCSLALEDWCSGGAAAPRSTVNFLSGSATSPDVEERLQPRHDVCGSLRVSFRRTVVSDQSMQAAGFKFFEEELGWHRADIGILVESDSSYGRRFLASEETKNLRSRYWRLVLPMPSALASVRTAAERSRKVEEVEIAGVRVPSYSLDLRLDEVRAPRDSFPVFDPMTAPLNELELESLLSTLAREKIRHLGLLFTDIRDKLFVAEKVKAYAPHMSMFTFESSVLYVHPRVNPYTDGMLVVSSYPLSMITQRLLGRPSGSGGQRIQFGSDPEQGLYNATVIALSEQGQTPAVADYLTIPETHYLAPAVWISAVGDGRLVPIAAVRPYGKSDLPQYLAKAEREPGGATVPDSPLPPELRTLVRRLAVPAGFRFCFWVATVVFVLFGVSLVAGYAKPGTGRSRRIAGHFRPLVRPDDGARRQQKRWLAALIATFFASWTALATVYLVPFVLRARLLREGGRPPLPQHGEWITFLEELLLRGVTKGLPLIALLLVAFLARLGWLLDRSGERRPRPVFAAILGATMAIAVILSHQALNAFRPEPFGGLDPSRQVLSAFPSDPYGLLQHAVFTYLRASAGPGSLSPLVGILFLAAGFALILLFQLQRLRIRDDWSCRMPVEALALSRDLPLRSLAHPQDNLDRRIRQGLPRSGSFWGPFLVLLGPLLVVFFLRFEATADSFLWSSVFAFLFAFVLLPSSLASFYRFASLWAALRRIIVRQEWSRLAPAFQSCQEELNWQSLRVWGPSKKQNYATLIGSVELLRRLCLRPERPRVTEEVSRTLGDEPVPLRRLEHEAGEALGEALEADARGEVESERVARVRVLAALDSASQHVQQMLNRLDAAPGPGSTDTEIRKELMDYVALRAIAYVRYVFAEIRNSLLAFTVGILFLLAGLAAFHFQPIRSVYVVLWSVIGVIAIWTIAIFLQMDRNTVLSRISGTSPGDVNPIKSGLFLRIAAFVLPPVIGLLVTQFPRMGESLSSWLNPLIRVFQ